MTAEEILEKVKSLNFPNGQYVVAGSGIMVMHQLRETNDIDIVVSKELFDACMAQGSTWEKIAYTYADKIGSYWLKKIGGETELYLDVNCGDEFRPTLEELLSRAEYFDEVAFISLEDLVKFKKSYNRPKDSGHIQLIEGFLKTR